MIASLHDNYLIAYEVSCEERTIKLRARAPEWSENPKVREFLFTNVEGYHFRNDAFGNIIYSLEEILISRFLDEYALEIEESHRSAGAPGAWAADLATANWMLEAEGVRAFVLSSSYGLSGWLLAKEVQELL